MCVVRKPQSAGKGSPVCTAEWITSANMISNFDSQLETHSVLVELHSLGHWHRFLSGLYTLNRVPKCCPGYLLRELTGCSSLEGFTLSDYQGIHTGYHSRAYWLDTDRSKWPMTVKFHEDRLGLKFLPQGPATSPITRSPIDVFLTQKPPVT